MQANIEADGADFWRRQQLSEMNFQALLKLSFAQRLEEFRDIFSADKFHFHHGQMAATEISHMIDAVLLPSFIGRAEEAFAGYLPRSLVRRAQYQLSAGGSAKPSLLAVNMQINTQHEESFVMGRVTAQGTVNDRRKLSPTSWALH